VNVLSKPLDYLYENYQLVAHARGTEKILGSPVEYVTSRTSEYVSCLPKKAIFSGGRLTSLGPGSGLRSEPGL